MSSIAGLIKVGPADRNCRRYPENFDLPGRSEISQIFISRGEYGIMAIQFQYVENGKYVLSDKYGSTSGSSEFYTIQLRHPGEYITGVNGLYSCSSDNVQVITFTTNIKKYGPFGVINTSRQMLIGNENLESFVYNLGTSSQFGGFHGTWNSYGLLSIGLYLSPKPLPPNFGSNIPKKEA